VIVKLALCGGCGSVLAGVLLLAATLWQPGGQAHAAGPRPPKVVAEHAIVVDAASGAILLDKSADEPVPPASLTKLFTAEVALESVAPEHMMTVQHDDLVGEASMGLRTGEELSFDALLHGMLLASGNDAAMTVAQNIGQLAGDSTRQAVGRFMDHANARLAALGLDETHLRNPHGLDEDEHLSSARDIAAITRDALNTQPAFAQAIGAADYHGAGHTLEQTNELLGRYPGLLGGKTGFTAKAGYCLMEVAQRGDQRVIVALLGSTADAWYADAAALVDFGFVALATPGAPGYGVVPGTAPAGAAVTSASASQAGVAVAQVGADGALVATSGATPAGTPWRWVGAALLLLVGGLLGLAQALRQRSRSARRAPLRPAPVTPLPRSLVARSFQTAPFETIVAPVAPQPAASLAREAVALAGEQHFQEAARAFYSAAQLDRPLDLPQVPGFWSLCPRGHAAAAAALVKAGRLGDARTLAIVLGLRRDPALSPSGD
jgi:D-alanyl-D-alanine carboxypeptidase (penicillin-binding protein 5/6)